MVSSCQDSMRCGTQEENGRSSPFVLEGRIDSNVPYVVVMGCRSGLPMGNMPRHVCICNLGNHHIDKPVEALRDLQPLMEKRDLVLACLAAMIYAHRQCKTPGTQ